MKMNMADSSSYRLETGGYLGEISALCFVHLPPNLSSSPLLLVGSGSQLLLYNVELGKLLNSFHVFQGIRVHGISISFLDATNDEISLSTLVVFGETRVKIFTLRFQLNQSKLCADLVLNHRLPRFSHWVMDVLLLTDYVSSLHKVNDHLVVGLGDNSICLWGIARSTQVFRVRCPEKTLLYSMRLWGDDINSLRVASGTIYNEVIVWKLVSQRHSSSHTNPLEHSNHYNCLLSDENELRDRQYEAIYMNRLAGHEGSIFRLSWSPDGSKLLSVSDDRSARLWNIDNGTLDSLSSRDVGTSDSVGLMVFGHSARVWDCYFSDSFIVTAGEDCTCRVWGLDGQQLFLIKEHSGRGIWRCIYDPKSSVLITAGFDASVKVHMLHASLSRNTTAENSVVVESSKERMEVFTLSVPHLTDQLELLNSKSEYVRCLHFTREDTLYVATNNGYLYHVKLSHATNVKWTELVRISEDSPIVCMDILPKDSCMMEEDWIVVGDGRGNATVVNVVDTVCTPIVHLTFTWSAGTERQLLGTYWCKSLGHSYIFTADPKGILKLWNIHGSIQSGFVPITGSFKALLTAEFISCFGTRVVSLDALFDEQVLVCGDQRGNLTVFSLSKSLVVIPCTSEAKYSPIISFKGAHGISSVTSISVSATSPNQIEIRSTGGDGCICFFKYDGNWGSLEFTGMKQVKELSLIQSFTCDKDLISSYAVGFASAEFIVWNVQNEIKVVQVSCGGWRRPHSYYLGDVPESRNCFAFVKDHTIHIHRLWVPDSEKKLIPHVLHMQFHGREIHSLCFISNSLHLNSDENTHLNGFSCIATGCEDGTVRLTRYAPDHQNWLASKLLGEHVGGSAVRSICFVSKIYKIALDGTCMFSDQHECIVSSKETDNPSLLISVGAKRVLTSWLLQKKRLINNKVMVAEDCIDNENTPQEVSTSISFQWLSTDMPSKFSSTHKTIENAKECSSQGKNVTNGATCKTRVARHNELQSKPIPVDKFENDWRYLAVTAFLVKGADCRSTVCFIVVSCSDATLTLRALILPYRLWFDVAVFVPQTTPVLSLQNITLPSSPSFQESIQIGCAYILISGSTDGSITFWDMTESVQRFMERLSEVQPQSYIDSQKRPRTGRGSQGGRWWRTLHNRLAKTDSDGVMGAIDSENTENEDDKTDSSLEICNVKPFHVLDNVHQSGVNCLHVSSKGGCDSVSSSYCVLSGGDDQALTCLTLNLSLEKMGDGSAHQSCDNSIQVFVNNEKRHCRIKFLCHDRIISAHSSAIKGVWGDGRWAFSTGLDQRVRCWEIKEEGKLREHTHAIISVTEPETLDARAGGRGGYEIAVAGRGMQMLMFSASHDQPNK